MYWLLATVFLIQKSFQVKKLEKTLSDVAAENGRLREQLNEANRERLGLMDVSIRSNTV